MKELKQDKKHIEQQMVEFMAENNVEECNLPENTGKLKFNKSNSLAPVTQQNVKDGILKFFTEESELTSKFNVMPSEEKAEYLINYIYKVNREVKEKKSLR